MQDRELTTLKNDSICAIRHNPGKHAMGQVIMSC